MAHPDDRDADLARIAALEQQLAKANARVVSLEGRGAVALARQARWAGAPLRVELSRVFEGALPADKLGCMLPLIRSHSRDPGAAQQLEKSLSWGGELTRKAGPTFVQVAIDDVRTTLRVTHRLDVLHLAVTGGTGGVMGFLLIPVWVGALPFALVSVVAACWLGCAFIVGRTIFKRAARRRAAKLQRLFDALANEIATALGDAPR